MEKRELFKGDSVAGVAVGSEAEAFFLAAGYAPKGEPKAKPAAKKAAKKKE
jgi:hypothetical protein